MVHFGVWSCEHEKWVMVRANEIILRRARRPFHVPAGPWTVKKKNKK